jgi:hypothetical protein
MPSNRSGKEYTKIFSVLTPYNMLIVIILTYSKLDRVNVYESSMGKVTYESSFIKI